MGAHIAEMGETITRTYDDDPVPYEVSADCGYEGYWFCVTHNEPMAMNLNRDEHVRTGSHKLVWWCYDHGPETVETSG